MTEKSSKRLSILSAEEIEALYARPKFSDEERQDYFALSPLEETFWVFRTSRGEQVF